MASPRAVSIRIGVAARARIRRQTSRPSMSGSIRSSTMASKASRACRARPGAAVGGAGDAEARLAEIVADHLGEAGVVLDQQDAVGHGRILPAVPARQIAPDAIRGARRSCAAARASAPRRRRRAPARSACWRRRRAPSARRGTPRWRPGRAGLVSSARGALARGLGLLAHRQQVLDGGLGDGAQLLLLLGRGVELDGRVPDDAVDAVLDLGRRQGRRMKPRPCQPGPKPWLNARVAGRR